MAHNSIEDMSKTSGNWFISPLLVISPSYPPAPLTSATCPPSQITMPPSKTTLEIGGTPIQHGSWPQQPTSGAWSATSGRSVCYPSLTPVMGFFCPNTLIENLAEAPNRMILPMARHQRKQGLSRTAG